jgi:6-pyruvoyl-tetrahydropterin synthase
VAFRLTLTRDFVADHYHDLPGFVEPRHGHNWQVETTLEITDPEQEEIGQTCLDKWVAAIDYQLLNDLPWLTSKNPTAECLAQWLFEDLLAMGLDCVRVRVREKANYWAACRREDHT